MKLVHYIALFAVLIVVAWGSLFFTILSQTSKLNRTLAGIQSVLNQDNAILRAQKKQPTTTDLNTKLIALQTHVDCLFNLATQPNHSAYIKNAKACTIALVPTTPSASSKAAVPSSSSQPKVFVSSSPPQSAPSPDNKQTQPPQPNLIQRLFKKL